MSDCAPDLLAGQTLTITITFTRPPVGIEVGPQPCAPDTVDARMKIPSGAIVGLSPVVTADPSVWTVATPELTNPGRYWLRAEGVGGGCTTAAETTWNVVAGRVA